MSDAVRDCPYRNLHVLTIVRHRRVAVEVGNIEAVVGCAHGGEDAVELDYKLFHSHVRGRCTDISRVLDEIASDSEAV
jgi:hypothetical protein